MKTNEIFLDTNIPMYAAGKDHHYKRVCLKVLELVARRDLSAFTDVEVFQEILHRFISQRKAEIGFQIFDNFYKLMRNNVLPVTAKEILKARGLAEKYPEAKARDILHLAVMKSYGLKTIITVDTHFDKFQELTRMEPKEFLDYFESQKEEERD